MGSLGATELIIILAILLLIFGASRIADIGGSLGKGIREFRQSVRDDDDQETTSTTSTPSTTSTTSNHETPR